MEIKFQNKHQVEIADILWQAQDEKSVSKILKKYGKDAVIVYNMLTAHYLDSVTDTDLAMEVIRRVKC